MIKIYDDTGKYNTIDNPNMLRISKKNIFKGWYCSVGQTTLHIKINGDVYRGNCGQGGKIGNIYDLNLKLKKFDDYIICEKDICGCISDIRLTKAKEKKFLKLFENDNETGKEIKDFVAIKYDNTDVLINWTFTQRCNYECSYCPPYFHSKTSPHPPYDIMLYNLDKILDLYKNQKIQFHFAGGEPTLHPNFLDLVKTIYEKTGNKSWLTSNMSRSLKYFNQLSKYVSMFMCSFHPDHMWESRDKQFEKITKLVSANPDNLYILRFMMKLGMVHEIIDYSNTYINLENIKKEFIPIRKLGKNGKYLSELENYDVNDLDLIYKAQSN